MSKLFGKARSTITEHINNVKDSLSMMKDLRI